MEVTSRNAQTTNRRSQETEEAGKSAEVAEMLSKIDLPKTSFSPTFPALITRTLLPEMYGSDSSNRQDTFWEMSHQSIVLAKQCLHLFLEGTPTPYHLKTLFSNALNFKTYLEGVRELAQNKTLNLLDAETICHFVDWHNQRYLEQKGPSGNQESPSLLEKLQQALSICRFLIGENRADSYSDKYLKKVDDSIFLETTIGENYPHPYSSGNPTHPYGDRYAAFSSKAPNVEIFCMIVSQNKKKLCINPDLFRLYEKSILEQVNTSLQKVAEKKLEDLNDYQKKYFCGTLFCVAYLSSAYLRGSAHNSILLMMSVYSSLFPEQKLPAFKPDLLPDLELCITELMQ